MPIINIYTHTALLTTRVFHYRFEVIKSLQSEEIRFFTDKEEDTIDFIGTILLLIRYFGGKPEIVYILPDWTFIIDDRKQEQKLYTNVEVNERKIELLYTHYRFVCDFRSR